MLQLEVLKLPVRLVLTATSLTVQESVAIWDPTVAASLADQFDRIIGGSFGFSVRGGSECGLPVLVSKVQLRSSSESASGSRSGAAVPEAAKVDYRLCSLETPCCVLIRLCVDRATHEEAVARLRNAGQTGRQNSAKLPSSTLDSNTQQLVTRVLPQQELLDKRSNAFFLHVGGGGEAFYMSASSSDEVQQLERCWFNATSAALNARARRGAPVMFKVTCQGVYGTLTFDLNRGVEFKSDPRSRRTAANSAQSTAQQQTNWFTASPVCVAPRTIEIRLSICTLVASSAEAPAVVRVIQAPDLQLMLIVLHAFLSSKLAAVDPLFHRHLAGAHNP
uniref:Uncharacterized protein n=1 Tax=Macrostomum lignano TaxID=282301 RepID=A0A1I8FBI8_9PLAT